MDGITIEMARAKAKLIQKEMAKKLGTNRVTYSDYEKNKTLMRIDLTYKFSQITGVRWMILFF